MKKLIIILLILVVLGVILYKLIPTEEKSSTKKITNKITTYENQVINDIVLVKNISINQKKKIFSAEVKNLTGNTQNYKALKIVIKTKNKTINLIGYFDGLESEEEKIITAQTNTNLKNIRNIKFTLES